DVIENGRELLATIAREQVERTTYESLHGLRDPPQRLISSEMPVAVVVGFEVIDIDQQDANGAAVLDRLLPQADEVVIEHPPVLRAGERVMLRQIRDQVLFQEIGARLPVEVPGRQGAGSQRREQEDERADGLDGRQMEVQRKADVGGY